MDFIYFYVALFFFFLPTDPLVVRQTHFHTLISEAAHQENKEM